MSSASKMALVSSDEVEILAEAVQDQRIPSSCTAKGIVIIDHHVHVHGADG
jgi:hypothetical protein